LGNSGNKNRKGEGMRVYRVSNKTKITHGFNWLTDEAKEIFRELFDDFSRDIANLIKRSHEIQDNLADEEYITKKLVERINQYKKRRKWRNIQKEFKRNGLKVNLKARSNEKSSESKIGADLGIVLKVDGNDFKMEKAILVQAKKAYVDGQEVVYKELFKELNRDGQKVIKGVEQAEKMLKITPASFFFLYNSSEILNLNNYKESIIKHFLKIKEVNKMIICKVKIKEGIYLAVPVEQNQIIEFGDKKTLESYIGIFVLPAIQIASIKNNKNKILGSLETLLPYCVCFSDFMVDYFLSCFVGDKRKGVLEKAGAMGAEKAGTRYTMEIKVSIERIG
jgi:hypothetical protein